MKKLMNIKNPLTPERSPAKQISWLPEKNEIFQKSPNTSLTIALIAGERVYWSMQHEGKILALTEANWQWVLRYGDLDLLLIESCVESATGDWRMAQTAVDFKSSAFGKLIKKAQQYNIPIAYWYTLDERYISQYLPLIECLGDVFCADNRLIDNLQNDTIKKFYLPPAVQPALPISYLEPEKNNFLFIVLDDLPERTDLQDKAGVFCNGFSCFKFLIFDAFNTVKEKSRYDLGIGNIALLGKLDYDSRRAFISQSHALILLKSNKFTRTDLQWIILEAVSSGVVVLLESGLDVGVFEKYCLLPETLDDLFIELYRIKNDTLYYKDVVYRSKIKVNFDEVFFNRFSTICKKKLIIEC
jgi:hypothetical protein